MAGHPYCAIPMNEPDRPLPEPLKRQLDEIFWIQANLRPGEKLSDFLPPPAPAPARPLPKRPLFGDRRVKRWPLWAEALAFLVLLVALPAVLSLGIAALAIALPFWCVWRGWQMRNQPKPKPWAPPRVIPPYRRRMSIADEADFYAP